MMIPTPAPRKIVGSPNKAQPTIAAGQMSRRKSPVCDGQSVGNKPAMGSDHQPSGTVAARVTAASFPVPGLPAGSARPGHARIRGG